MPDVNEHRRDELRKTLADDQVEAILVTSVTNVGYLTGFSGDSTALLVLGDRALVISDGRYTLQLQQECPDVEAHIRPVNQRLILAIAEVIGKLGTRRLAIESSHMTVADFETLREQLPTVAFHGVQNRVERLRALKDATEIAAIREAIAQAERAFAAIRSRLRPDQTEKQIADDLEHELRHCGASGASFEPIIAVGPHCALPHYRPDAQTRVEQGDILLIDWGANGPSSYKSDLTRVLVTGMVTPKFETVYRSVLDAQERAIAAIRPGARAREVDAEARSAIEDAGFGGFFQHGLGHGLGRDIHEAPMLRMDSDETLQPGMVVTVEPGIYLPGWGGVRIEDDILVTPEGHEVLTNVPRTLDSVRR